MERHSGKGELIKTTVEHLDREVWRTEGDRYHSTSVYFKIETDTNPAIVC
jgi:hypothetical protein